MEYINTFNTTAEYNAAKSGETYGRPHVSLVLDNNEIHYEVDSKLVAKFNVTSTSSPTKIGYNAYTSAFTKIEIDGVEQPSVVSAYTFDTTGEHEVKYTLRDETTINIYAFYNCSGLTSITIPDSVTSIGNNAFYNCSGLTSITIPDSVTSIGDGTFGGCVSLPVENNIRYADTYAIEATNKTLATYTLKNETKFIGGVTFRNCYNLTSVTIPSNVISIGENAFLYCSGLTSIVVESGNVIYDSRNNCNAIIETQSNTLIQGCKNTIIPNNVTSIGNKAFFVCKDLTSINIPNSVTSIGNGTFDGCSSLTSITIPNSVTSIGNSAFNGCSSLISVTIPNSVTSIGDGVFQYCTSLPVENSIRYADTYAIEATDKTLTTYTIKQGTRFIGTMAFESCRSLTSITIPNSVTTIYLNAFYNCESLSSVTIPNSVTSIGEGAFGACISLTSITIGSGVTSIGPDTFNHCGELTVIYSYATIAPTIENNRTFNEIRNNGTLNVPQGSTGYNVWMSSENLGQYNWTKVEQ